MGKILFSGISQAGTAWLKGGAKITTHANPGGRVGRPPADPLKTELECEVVGRVSSIYCITGAQSYVIQFFNH